MSTLAEQVVEQLKTDMDNVYDAGYQKGKSEGGTDLLEYASWLNSMFSEVTFPENTDLVINLGTKSTVKYPRYSVLANAFMRAQGIRSIKLNMRQEEVKQGMDNVFYMIETLESIDVSNTILLPTSISGFFYGCINLRTITGKLNVAYCTNFANAFYMCGALEDIEFAENSININIDFGQSKLLSDASIQSIIDGLADLTGQTTQTITFHADVKAKLTEEQIASITAKNWTLA